MPQDIIVTSQNLHIYTETFGKNANPACLLIAGAMAPGRFWTDFFCNALAEAGFFVIRYDHRDSGLSSGVNFETTPYSLKELGEDVLSILDALGIKKAHAVGHSMGGYICQRLSIDHPGRLLSITSISAGALGLDQNKLSPLTPKEEKLQAKTWEVFLCREDSEDFEEMINGYMAVWRHLNGTVPFDDALARGYTIDLLTKSKHKLIAGNNHELVMSGVYEQLLENVSLMRKIKTPMLVIQGEKDPLVLPREAKAFIESVVGAVLHLELGMGHMIFNRSLELKIIEQILSHMRRVQG